MYISNTPSGRRYRHNGDFSGEVLIDLTPEQVRYLGLPGVPVAAAVPMEDLVAIVDAWRMANMYGTGPIEMVEADSQTMVTFRRDDLHRAIDDALDRAAAEKAALREDTEETEETG
ncbi:MAG: hypothetical protein ABWY93_18730 [Mycobacterium sp.]